MNTEAHCSGRVEAYRQRGRRSPRASTPIHACCGARSVHAAPLYEGFSCVGLQYGPSFRTLHQIWSGDCRATARLQTDRSQRLHLRPAGLDGALQATVLLGDGGSAGARLPFAVDEAMMHGGVGALRCPRGA